VIPSSTLDISSDRIIQWMNVVRDTSGTDQYRLLENFWASQLRSKAWLINTIKILDLPQRGNVYIFGGWYGILASLIKDNFDYDAVYSIDIDAECEITGKLLDSRIKFVTSDMTNITKEEIINASLIINTSTEHISQNTFDTWLNNMPDNVPIILQGNNYFSCEEHVRCSIDLEDFKKMNFLDVIHYEGELDCTQFTRYMIIGNKNDSN
jgi:hypothetical protein